ncbi:hypothetical protein C2869_05310 [Saccharobesus litoralis]|uniref:Cytochrome c domain-containing protein n=1 Tax=Saccharobesus litoralis TaxID=2172099 RepID=A0A2S0VNV6_9ALTE|nr:cytochrome c [Saccharobesus litoralis]AWB65894.1 hypothetical protein C2869_05310 [Saccharobesus litoralis]
MLLLSTIAKQLKNWRLGFCILTALVSNIANANSLDQEIIQLSQNQQATQQGKELFDTVCAACHAKNLTGGAGFNLKDEEWVHGAQPSDILNNVKQGFGNAGMPGFGAMFKDEQLKQIVAYVLSKREGFEQLNYKIYHANVDKKVKVTKYQHNKSDLPAKTGIAHNNLADFSIAEVPNYVIEYTGTLHAPLDQDTVLFAMIGKRQRLEVEIDGQPVDPSKEIWMQFQWPLKRGKQQLTLRYYQINIRKNLQPDAKLFVANQAGTQKLFGISPSGKSFLNQATVIVKAEQQPEVVRKKILDLPSHSIAVGYPNKVNYAFNAKSCSIVGVWTGELLNIGPNIEGRGRDGSLIPGEWKFKQPQKMAPQNDNNCRLSKYNRQGNPTFYFTLGEAKYSLSAETTNNKTLTFTYTLLQGEHSNLQWQLPNSNKVSISAVNATIKNNQLIILKNTPSWQVSVKLEG